MAETEFTKEAMQARFWVLEAQREAIMKQLAPLRARQDELQKQYAPIREEMVKVGHEVKAAQGTDLARIDEERAMLSRALGGNVGPRSYNT